MSGTPTGRSPFRWWSRSLPFRVVVSTVAAVVGILAVTGWFLLSQSAELAAALSDRRKIIAELDERMETELWHTCAAWGGEDAGRVQQLLRGCTALLEMNYSTS